MDFEKMAVVKESIPQSIVFVSRLHRHIDVKFIYKAVIP